MGDIADLLSLKEIKAIEGSNFNSSHSSYLEHIGEIPDKMGNLKEILLARINTKVLTGVNDLIEGASPTPSHLIVYELGCGLQTILPIDRIKGTVTASSEVILNKSLRDYVEFQKKRIHDSPGYKAVPVLEVTRYSQKRLIKLLKDKSFMPLVIEEAKPICLWEYLVRFSDNGRMTGISAERKVGFADSSVTFSYIAHTNRGENPNKVQSFEVKYNFQRAEKEIEMAIDLTCNQEGAYETYASITKRVVNGYEAQIKFENEGSPKCYISVSEQNKELMFSMEFLQRISSGMEVGQSIKFQDLAALRILNMPSLNSRLDYASTTKNIIKLALMPADAIKSNSGCYAEELEQFRPLIFR